MSADHVAYLFLPGFSTAGLVLRSLGRIAMPLFCFLMAQSFEHTRNRKKLLLRLLLFAALSHIPFVLCFKYSMFEKTSVFLTLALGFAALWICKCERLPIDLRAVLVVLCCVASMIADWGYVGVLWIICFGLLKNRLWQIAAFGAVGVFGYILPHYIKSILGGYKFYMPVIFILAAIPIFLIYDDCIRPARSPFVRIAFYVFYPLHLTVLYVINSAL